MKWWMFVLPILDTTSMEEEEATIKEEVVDVSESLANVRRRRMHSCVREGGATI